MDYEPEKKQADPRGHLRFTRSKAGREENGDATVIDRAEETPPGNRAMVKVHVRVSLSSFHPVARGRAGREVSVDRDRGITESDDSVKVAAKW